MYVVVYPDLCGTMHVGLESDDGRACELLYEGPDEVRLENKAFNVAFLYGEKHGLKVFLQGIKGKLLLQDSPLRTGQIPAWMLE